MTVVTPPYLHCQHFLGESQSTVAFGHVNHVRMSPDLTTCIDTISYSSSCAVLHWAHTYILTLLASSQMHCVPELKLMWPSSSLLQLRISAYYLPDAFRSLPDASRQMHIAGWIFYAMSACNWVAFLLQLLCTLASMSFVISRWLSMEKKQSRCWKLRDSVLTKCALLVIVCHMLCLQWLHPPFASDMLSLSFTSSICLECLP